MSDTAACGADGCRAGWLAVTLAPARRPAPHAGGPVRARAVIVPRAADLRALSEVVAIDVPIGLMDRPADGPRPADAAARAFLAARNADGLRGVGSRVFAAPCRAHLDAFRADRDYAAFRRAFPPPASLSKQAWNICDRIAEVDDLMRAAPGAGLWEVHPEVSFAFHAGRTLAPKKSTPRKPSPGPAQRRALLEGAGFDLARLAAGLGPRAGRWGMDDLFDACVAALSGLRIAAGRHAALPGPDARDSAGLRRAIFY